MCEIGLGKNIRYIQRHYEQLQKRNDDTAAAVAYLFQPLTLRSLLFLDGGRVWCRMWSTYSLYDPSYSNSDSFGFFVDVGNGYSTIVPCLMWNASILGCCREIITPTVLAFVGCCSYWQVLYGTIIYLLSFVWNQRHRQHSVLEVTAFVGATNGIWIVFPTLALIKCYQLIVVKDYDTVFYNP
jgi:hypothetical protein